MRCVRDKNLVSEVRYDKYVPQSSSKTFLQTCAAIIQSFNALSELEMTERAHCSEGAAFFCGAKFRSSKARQCAML